MKNVDIKQIVLDVLKMYEDPDIGSLTEPEFESFADEVERRVNKNESISDVSDRNLNVGDLKEKHPELTLDEALSLLKFCRENTIWLLGCYGDGSIMYPKWREQYDR